MVGAGLDMVWVSIRGSLKRRVNSGQIDKARESFFGAAELGGHPADSRAPR